MLQRCWASSALPCMLEAVSTVAESVAAAAKAASFEAAPSETDCDVKCD